MHRTKKLDSSRFPYNICYFKQESGYRKTCITLQRRPTKGKTTTRIAKRSMNNGDVEQDTRDTWVEKRYEKLKVPGESLINGQEVVC